MKIRLATKDDLASLNALVNSAYRGDTSRKGWTTEADLLDGIRTSESSLEAMMSKPNAVILLAEETALQGCVYLEHQERALYLGMLTVKPELQGKGIGAELMKAAEERAVMLGCNKIRMTVITDRIELISYYNRKGFIDTGERAPFPNDPKFGIPKKNLEFMVMEKEV